MRLIRCDRLGSRGVTLVELMVVLGIIGILLGLLLPAVQGARESARRAQCANNLGQLIRACHAFEAGHGGFPPAYQWGRPYVIGEVKTRLFTTQCLLLPYLDQATLYQSINFDLPSGSSVWIEQFQSTAAAHRVQVFLCPSDPRRLAGSLGPNTYRACTGLGDRTPGGFGAMNAASEGLFAPDMGFDPPRGVRLGEVRDGLSQTLAFSEKPIGSGTQATYHPFRDWSMYRGGDPLSPDEWMTACSGLAEIDPRLDAGLSWMIPDATATHFFASAPPNARVVDCGNPGLGLGVGIFAARSYHPGGVNAAMADGAVRWFGSGTAVRVWRALGTRAGGEVIDPG